MVHGRHCCCCCQDQFDTLELSDNDIRKLDGFPLLRRLKCIVLNNNRVSLVISRVSTFAHKCTSAVVSLAKALDWLVHWRSDVTRSGGCIALHRGTPAVWTENA